MHMKSKNRYTVKKKKRTPKSSKWFLLLALLFLMLAIIVCWLSFSLVDIIPNIPVTLKAPATQTPVPCDISLAFQSVEHNDDWTPCEKTFDGVRMNLVPIGCFHSDRTQVQVCIESPYWIDKFEVTNEQLGYLNCSHWSKEPNQPTICIKWLEAKTFCASRNAELPTEDQWEYAASGVDNLAYPWGDRWNVTNVHWSENRTGFTESVDSRPTGRSWVGAYHMSGNVWEWVLSTEDTYKIARGGSYNSTTTDMLSTFFRVRHYGNYNDNGTGFRCVREVNKSNQR